jgi:peptidoglycan/LPS O-acetylase OafA/YrhL
VANRDGPAVIDTAAGRWDTTGGGARRGSLEIQGLQLVRANAVLLVVFCHSAAILALARYFGPSPLVPLLAKGATGVDIFFVLSGFIIVHIALQERTFRSRLGPGSFLLKRFNRIVPFLWVSVILYGIVQFGGKGSIDPHAYIDALFFIPVGPLTPNVVWSLQHEALFYLLFAVAFLMRRRFPVVLYVWCIAPIALWVLSFWGLSIEGNELLAFVFNRANAFFGCGVLIGMVWKRFPHRVGRLQVPPAAAWVLILGATALTFLVRDWLGSVVTAVAASLVVIAGLVAGESRARVVRAWHLVGDASYAIYLTHNAFLLVGGVVWIRLIGERGYGAAVAVLGVAAVAGGVLIHLYVEKPVIRLSRRLTDALGARRASSVSSEAR